MELKENRPANRWKILCLLFILIAIAYGNSFQAGWHFDDMSHILFNPAVHLTNFTVGSITKTIYAAPRHDESSPPKIFRPLASLSFALNWYFGGQNVFGYHLVNVGIHCLTAFLLFLSISCLYKTPRMEVDRDGRQSFVALLAAVLWALSPIQTQAVTYIVQRMASMTAMFCMLGLFLYLKGRLSREKIKRVFCFAGAGAAIICAMASKENAIVFPFSMLLVEIIFFKSVNLTENRKKVFVLCSLTALSTVVLGLLLFSKGEPLSIFNGYGMRPYTLIERVMTQPRVLLLYLSQLFYPVATQLSFQHDIFHSTSLFNPWSTLPSMILVAALLAFACLKIRRLPLLSFAILFFFLNHMVESTILPLELVFEHRNYLPSMFLFLPVAAIIWKALAHYRARRSGLYYMLLGFAILLVAGFGWSTHIRNKVWSNEFNLWQDALTKAPGSIRPYINLGRTYQNSGDRQTARALYEQAINKYSERTKDYRVVLLNNIGEIYFAEGNYNKAIDIWSAAALRVKDHRSLRSNLVLAFARIEDWERALDELDRLLVKLPDNSQYNFLKGCYLIETGQYNDAIAHLRKAFLAGYDAPKTLANIGVVYYHKKNYSKAERFLKWASSGGKTTPEMLIWLLAVNLKLADLKDANYYSDEVLKTVSITALHSWFEQISDPDHHLYPEKTQIINYLMAKLPRPIEYVAEF